MESNVRSILLRRGLRVDGVEVDSNCDRADPEQLRDPTLRPGGTPQLIGDPLRSGIWVVVRQQICRPRSPAPADLDSNPWVSKQIPDVTGSWAVLGHHPDRVVEAALRHNRPPGKPAAS